MHPSSINNMIKARNHKKVTLGTNLTILDVGGRDLNGKDRTYKTIYEDIATNYYMFDCVFRFNGCSNSNWAGSGFHIFTS